MDSVGSSVVVGIVMFTSTNMDDLFVVSAFLADPYLARRSVVLGQFVEG